MTAAVKMLPISNKAVFIRHANVYTAEETVAITRDKLLRLQELYKGQFLFLFNEMRERRRRYVGALRKEKMCCGLHDQVSDNPVERPLYEKLKLLNSYHRRRGIDAVCHERLRERRIMVCIAVTRFNICIV